jgi:hypothetical protein
MLLSILLYATINAMDNGTYANNFTLVPILNNNFFWINNGRLQRHLDTDFFNSSLPGITDTLRRTLCWRDISVDGVLQSINQMSNTSDTNITPQVYRILDNAFKIARRNYEDDSQPALAFNDFFKKNLRALKKSV